MGCTMILGTVVGTVVSTRKNANLTGNKLLVVECFEDMQFMGKRVVAIDNVGAGIGEIVLVATGSAARLGTDNENAPVDAAIVGIVDDCDKIRIER